MCIDLFSSAVRCIRLDWYLSPTHMTGCLFFLENEFDQEGYGVQKFPTVSMIVDYAASMAFKPLWTARLTRIVLLYTCSKCRARADLLPRITHFLFTAVFTSVIPNACSPRVLTEIGPRVRPVQPQFVHE